MSELSKVVIVGSGPAGYSAAVYTARAELEPLVFAGESSGGQLMNTTMVENWPGAKDGVMGSDLMMNMRVQAEKFEAKVVDEKVDRVDFSKRPFVLYSGDKDYEAEVVILATGAEPIMLGVPGESTLLGRGVAVCAVCDAPFYKEKNVFVVGGGDAAVEDAIALTKYASKVTMLVRRDELRASKIMVKRVEGNEKITVLWNTELKEVMGEMKVEGIRVMNNKTNKEQELQADGVFLAIGHKPATGFLEGSGVELDEKGYVVTGITYPSSSKLKAQNSKAPLWIEGYPTMTSVEGVFAAGDNVDFRYKQAATAAGMGVMAALDAEKWLERGV